MRRVLLALNSGLIHRRRTGPTTNLPALTTAAKRWSKRQQELITRMMRTTNILWIRSVTIKPSGLTRWSTTFTWNRCKNLTLTSLCHLQGHSKSLAVWFTACPTHTHTSLERRSKFIRTTATKCNSISYPLYCSNNSVSWSNWWLKKLRMLREYLSTTQANGVERLNLW